MAVPVDIVVRDSTVSHVPISGAALTVHNVNTFATVAQATTDVNGRAAFLLPGAAAPGLSYEVRAWKSGVIFSNPARIAVLEPADPLNPNAFDLFGSPYNTSWGVPSDPRQCRCVGRFVDFSGAPLVSTMVKISTEVEDGLEVPKIIDGSLVAARELNLRTNASGYVVVDLMRNGEYRFWYPGEEGESSFFKVPDAASANLIDLVFAQPVSVSYDPPSLTMAVGFGTTAKVTMLFSNGQSVTADLNRFMTTSNPNPAIADVGFSNSLGQLGAVGKSPGTLTVNCTLLPNLYPRRVPDYSLVDPGLAITVTP